MAFSNSAYGVGLNQYIVNTDANASPYQTIASALAAAPSGSTIYVMPGTYTENLTSNMSGKTIVAATASPATAANFPVTVVGNHTFTSVGSVSFQNIAFSASSGVAFTVGAAGAGTYSADFQDCSISNSAGIGIQAASAGGSANLNLFNCIISGSTTGISVANGTSTIAYCQITGGSANALAIGASASVVSSLNIYTSTSSDDILLSSATATLNSVSSSYVSSSGSAFKFTANGTANTYSELISSGNSNTYFAYSSGAFGKLGYIKPALTGTAILIDPQITATALTTLPASLIGYTNPNSGTNPQSTALGVDAGLAAIAGGGSNQTAIGAFALGSCTSATGRNTAVGVAALGYGVSMSDNTAMGQLAAANATGNKNTCIGQQSGVGFTSGASNSFLGYNTGSNYTTSESNNIIIGAGVLGTVGESSTLRIGDSGATPVTKAFIGGISGVTVSNLNVVTINTSTGQLGSQAQGSPVYFNAYANATVNNVTGDGTHYNVICNATTLNVGSGFNTGTGIFTCPLSGTYLIGINISVQTGTFNVAQNYGDAGILLNGAGNLCTVQFNPFTAANNVSNINFIGSVMIQLALNDTLQPTVIVGFGSKNVNLIGGPFNSGGATGFWGHYIGP